MRKTLALFLLLAGTVSAGPASAADWGPPTKEFVADMTFRNGAGQERKAQLFYTPDKQRLEYVAGQAPVALLVDTTVKKMWLLLLNRREYVPTPYSPPDFFLGISNPDTKHRKVGEETLLGVPVDRVEVSAKSSTGDRFDGVAWVTADRIVVRFEGTAARGKQKQKLSMTMTKLTVGPVDASLLELPAGYKARPAPKPKR